MPWCSRIGTSLKFFYSCEQANMRPEWRPEGYGNNDEEKRGWNWLMALKALLPHHFQYSLH